MRDDFSEQIKTKLHKRVGGHCSNPECSVSTIGPHSNPEGTINLGVAAHITAASPRGPRYDASLSIQARKSVNNGIWLCQSCAKLVDSDHAAFPIQVLRDWKTRAERKAARE